MAAPVRHKTPGNLNDGLPLPHDDHNRPVRVAPAASKPVASRAPTPVAPQPRDGVDAPPATNGLPSAGPQGDALVAQANSQANEMWAMNATLMRIQHEQAKQKLVVEAASAISKNASEVGEFLLNKI